MKYNGVHFDSLRTYELQHEYVTTHGPESYGRFADQFKTFFDLSNQIILGINYINKDSWPKHRALQFLFVIHNLRVLYSATDRLLKGHWEDSLVLMRVNLEALVRIIWISCHPSRLDASVTKTKDKGKQFNFTNFTRDELKLKWHDYQFMSPLSHGATILVLMDWLAIYKKEKQYPLQLERKFDKIYFELCANTIDFLEVAYLMFLTEVFATGVNDSYLPQSLIEEARQYTKLKQETMRSHPREYWPQVAKDLEDLMKLIQACDNGGDYKECWNKIRSG